MLAPGEGAGPRPDHGNPDPALQKASLRAREGTVPTRVVRGPAVVREEHDQRIGCLVLLLQAIDHPPDAAVEGMDHRRVGAPLLVLDARKEIEVLPGRLKRPVGGVVSEVEKKRFLRGLGGCPVDPGNGLIGEKIGEVGARELGKLHAVALQPVVFRGGEIAVASVEHAAEVIEAPAVGVEDPAVAEMPFADEGGSVACGLEVIGERVLVGGQAKTLGARRGVAGILNHVSLVAETPGIAPGDQAGPRRGADGARDITPCAENPIGRQGIEIGGFEQSASVETEIAVSHVIGDDQHDVRS